MSGTDEAGGERDGAARQGPTYDVRQLLGGAREASLVLDSQTYRLRITAGGKLILTK